MKIKVVYIHNTQALEPKVKSIGSTWNNWKTYMQNNMRFNYENDRLNGKTMRELPTEMLEAMQGNY